MSEARKFLLMAVGLIITVILCYYGFSLLRRGTEMSDFVAQSQDKGLTEAKEYGLLKYDGYTINGSTAINYIKTAVTDYGVEAHLIKTVAGAPSTGIIDDTADFSLMRDVTSPSLYINPLKEYKCTVHKDANGAYSYIEVVEQ